MTNKWKQRIKGDIKAMGGSIYGLKHWHETILNFWKDVYKRDKDERSKSRIDFETKYLKELNEYEKE